MKELLMSNVQTARRRSSQAAFTLIEVMIIINILGILLIIAIPSWIHARAQSQAKSCSKNLVVIDRAKQQWALNNKIANTNTTVPTLDASATTGLVGPSNYIKSTPICPLSNSSSVYSVGNINTDPTCSNDTPPAFRHTVTGN